MIQNVLLSMGVVTKALKNKCLLSEIKIFQTFIWFILKQQCHPYYSTFRVEYQVSMVWAANYFHYTLRIQGGCQVKKGQRRWVSTVICLKPELYISRDFELGEMHILHLIDI